MYCCPFSLSSLGFKKYIIVGDKNNSVVHHRHCVRSYLPMRPTPYTARLPMKLG